MERVWILRDRYGKPLGAFVNDALMQVVANDIDPSYTWEFSNVPLVTHPHEAVEFREAEKLKRK